MDNVTKKTLTRRDLMTKVGAGAGVAVAMLKNASAQQGQQVPTPPTSGLDQASHQNEQRFPDIRQSEEVVTSVQTGYITKTGPGWVNNSGRASGNGPMDECSRRIVEWVHKLSESDLTDSCVETSNYLQHDTLGSLYGGF